MKKQLLTFLSLLASAGALQAQAILNGNFENWNSQSFDEPNSWITGNAEHPELVTVTKVAGFAGFGVKMQTKADPTEPTDFLGGFISNTKGDPTSGEGGVPFSQRPTAITGKYMANMMGSDTAVLLVVFKKNGIPFSVNIFKLNGKNQTTFSDFSFALNLSQDPDSVVIASASSNLITEQGIEVGSNIVLDNIALTGPGVTQTLPNANFEQWTTKTIEELADWNYNIEGIVKSTDKFKGSFALKLSTHDWGEGNLSHGYISNSSNNRGRPFTNTNDTLIGWYKYATTTNDSGVIYVNISKDGSGVSGGFKSFTPTSVYTYFEIPLFAPQTPDSLSISISSGTGMNAALGNELIIDEIQLKSAPLNTGLIKWNTVTNYMSLFPNPCNNGFNFVFLNQTNASDFTYQIIDVTGKLVDSGDVNSYVNTQKLTSGFYYVQVLNNNQLFAVKKLIRE